VGVPVVKTPPERAGPGWRGGSAPAQPTGVPTQPRGGAGRGGASVGSERVRWSSLVGSEPGIAIEWEKGNLGGQKHRVWMDPIGLRSQGGG
jgi:hypothetical protein